METQPPTTTPIKSVPVDNSIAGKMALVTGASGGIGAACARDLWAHGANLALTYNTNRASLDALITELQNNVSPNSPTAIPQVTAHQADVSSEADLARLYEDVALGNAGAGPDILIVNAGYGKRVASILDLTLEEWDYTMSVNLRSAFILTKLCVPYMQKQGWGRVVYISSIAATGTSINGCHYSASKAGLQGMSKNLALKMGRDGITFNDVAPAMVTETGMIRDEEALKGTPGDVSKIPVGRSGRPVEVAGAVTMLCKTGYMTGQSLLLSGGLK